MNIIDLLDNETLFTKNELEIVHYIKENPQAVILMTIKELAQVTFSSNASIIRLCRKLGYKGFRDFKIDFMRYMESLKYVRQDIDFSFPFQSDEPTWQIINSLARVYKESIDLINSQLDIDELEKIVDLLDRSQRVFIYATGDSKMTAMGFTNKLIKIGKFFLSQRKIKKKFLFLRLLQLKMWPYLSLILSRMFIVNRLEYYYIIMCLSSQLPLIMMIFYLNIVAIIY